VQTDVPEELGLAGHWECRGIQAWSEKLESLHRTPFRRQELSLRSEGLGQGNKNTV